ncbi:MAG: hypothetical protein ACP5LF_06175 [Nitrososphaeria archaeon]
MPLDYIVLALGFMITAGFYSWIFRGHANFFDNLGTAFVFAFIALLLIAAFEFSIGNEDLANLLSEYAYFAILIGVVLKAVSMALEKRSN